MNTHRARTRTAVLAVLAVCALPAGASAAPSVFTQTAKVVPTGQTPDNSWTQSNLDPEAQYLVSDNGYTVGLKESNGVTTGGLLSYDVLPSLYRQLFAASRLITEGSTGAQPHATCDVASLNQSSVVTGWQGTTPSYGYIPFQATSAGLGDDPATWLTKVKDATGVTLTPSTDLAAACTDLGGTFHAADTIVKTSASLASGLTAPLDAKIASLTTERDKALADLKAAQADVKALKLEATPLTIKIPTSATLQRGLEVNVTGPPNRGVFIRIVVTDHQQRKLKLKFKTLGVGRGVTDEKGKTQVIVWPQKKTAPALLKLTESLPVTVVVYAGDRGILFPYDIGA